MTKISNFALKIKGGGREGGTCEVLRPCQPPKFGTCTRPHTESYLRGDFILMCLGDTVKTKENQFLSFSRKIIACWKKFFNN